MPNNLSIKRILEIDPVKAGFVKKIDRIISDAKNGTVPKDLISSLEEIRADYIYGRIATIGQLRSAILNLASKTEATLEA